MAKFIMIVGTQNSGKTTTAGMVYKELLSVCNSTHWFADRDGSNNNGLEEVDKDSLKFYDNGSTRDFIAILEFKNKKIGIVSHADVASRVKVDVQICIDFHVDIILCCARSVDKAGSVYRMLYEEFDTSIHERLAEIWTLYADNAADKFLVKAPIVAQIMELILKNV